MRESPASTETFMISALKGHGVAETLREKLAAHDAGEPLALP
jgi:hypothetical protein